MTNWKLRTGQQLRDPPGKNMMTLARRAIHDIFIIRKELVATVIPYLYIACYSETLYYKHRYSKSRQMLFM